MPEMSGKGAGQRDATAAALAEDLGRFLGGRPTAARPPWPIRRPWMWACRNKVGAAALAVVFVVLIAAIIGLFAWADDETRLRQAAQNETVRAVKAENAALDLAHLERVRAARTAAGRGQWDEAETHYAEAVADDRDDRLALEVERLRGWWTYERRPQLGPELERLSARRPRPAPGRGAARPRRLRHERSGSAEGGPRMGRRGAANARRALAADRAYAKGLLATTATEAVARFEEAVNEDPFHYRANAALLTEFLMAGRFDERGARPTSCARCTARTIRCRPSRTPGSICWRGARRPWRRSNDSGRGSVRAAPTTCSPSSTSWATRWSRPIKSTRAAPARCSPWRRSPSSSRRSSTGGRCSNRSASASRRSAGCRTR